MNETDCSQVCERTEDLISFLYGELGERETRSFEQHRRSCPACESEVNAFGPIRQSILAWRDQSLGLASPDSVTVNPIPVFAAEGTNSALAAIRGFFALSPWWMKGATAVAAVLFCLLAGLAIARLPGTSQSAPQVSAKGTGSVSEADIERRIQDEVKRRVEAEIAALSSQKDDSAPTIPDPPLEQRKGAIAHRRTERDQGVIPTSQKLRKPLTRAEREQLAADLRLITEEDEDSLQLLGDRINR
jgi:anti-sigma factor RsiW